MLTPGFLPWSEKFAELAYLRPWNWWLKVRLRAFERRLARAAQELQDDESCVFALVQLELAIKAISSFRASLLLRGRAFAQEGATCHRSFVEAWIYLAYFTWYPSKEALHEWSKNPQHLPQEKKFQIKQTVEQEFAARLRLSPSQSWSPTGLFARWSNTAVHPTRCAVEEALQAAIQRAALYEDNDGARKIQVARRNAAVFTYMTISVEMGWFLRFIRLYVFSQEPLQAQFPRPSVFEQVMEKWLSITPSRLTKVFEKMEQDYIRKKRAERFATKEAASAEQSSQRGQIH
jgi:hypothetical protein